MMNLNHLSINASLFPSGLILCTYGLGCIFCMCVGCTGALDGSLGAKATLAHRTLWQVYVAVD